MPSLDDYIRKLEEKIEIKVGFPKNKQVIYPPDDRKGHKNKGGQSVAQVATWNTFGTSKIPKRPFMQEALKDNKDKIEEIIKGYFKPKNIFDDRYLDKVGVFMKNMIVDKITDGVWKENSDYTKARKKSDKPLIDTGLMRKSVNYEITKK